MRCGFPRLRRVVYAVAEICIVFHFLCVARHRRTNPHFIHPLSFIHPLRQQRPSTELFKYNGAAAALELKICETWPSHFPRTRGGGVLTDRFCLLPYETERQQSFTPKKLKPATFLHVCSKNCPTAYLARCIFGWLIVSKFQLFKNTVRSHGVCFPYSPRQMKWYLIRK